MAIEQCRIFFESIASNETLAQGVTWEQIVQNCPLSNFASSDLIGSALLSSMIVLGIFIALITLFAVYIYTSLAWYAIARKLKHPRPWLAWIPFASWALQLQLGGFHWAWIFLILIPILGWIALFVLLIVSRWSIYEKRKYSGWFSLAVIIPKVGSILHLIAIGFIAWLDKETEEHRRIQIGRTKKPRSRKTKKA